MSSGQKVAFSFLTTIVLFTAFVLLANPRIFNIKKDGFLSQLESRFYKQAVIAEKQSQLDKLSDSCKSYIENILDKVDGNQDAFLKDPDVKTFYFEKPDTNTQTALAIHKRRLARVEQLQRDLPELEGIRILDNSHSNQSIDRRDVHYSTYTDGDNSDKLKYDGDYIIFKNYEDIVEGQRELSSGDLIDSSSNPKVKLLIDQYYGETDEANRNRLVMSFPFSSTGATCDLTLVCYFNVSELVKKLTDEDKLLLGENFDTVSGAALQNYKDEETSYSKYSGGFVTGIPHDMLGKEKAVGEFYEPVLKNWKNWKQGGTLERLLEGNDFTWVILTNEVKSDKYNVGFKISGVYKSTIFELPKETKILIYLSVLISILLVAFLVFSLKRDYLTKIRFRVKKVQLEIIKEYLENHEKVEWNAIALQIAARKDDLNDEIKKSIGGKSKKFEKETEALLESSWDEILTVIGAKAEKNSESLSGATIDEIRRVLEEVLQSTELNVNVAKMSKLQAVSVETVPAEEALDEVEEIDEIEEIEDVDAVEEIDEIEDIEDAETVEEIEDVETVEEVEAEPEAVEEVTEASPVAETVEIEPVEAEITEPKSLSEIISDEITEGLSPDEEETPAIEVSPAEEVEEIEEIEELEPEVPAEPAYEPVVISFDTSSVISGFETFVSSDESLFASVDSIFAEDLCIGNEYISLIPESDTDNYVFKTFVPNFVSDDTLVSEPEAENNITPLEETSIPTVEAEENEVVDVLEELRESVGQQEEAIAEEFEELPEAPNASVKNTVKVTNSAGTEKTFFTMTTAGSFGLSQEVAELEAAPDELDELVELPGKVEDSALVEPLEDLMPETLKPEIPELDTIIEDNGIFSISKNLSYSSVELDLNFKNLVDSVLR